MNGCLFFFISRKVVFFLSNNSINYLYNYTGDIFDMGIEANKEGKPSFFILTESFKHIQVIIDNAENLALVRDWLKRLNTGINVEFRNYKKFNQAIQKVFLIYGQRKGKFLHYDNSDLKYYKKELHLSDAKISRWSGIPKSTVNDLSNGITTHPHFFTVAKIHSAVYNMILDVLDDEQKEKSIIK